MIIEDRATMEIRLEDSKETISHIDYPMNLIEQGRAKAKDIPREKLRSNAPKDKTSNLLTFVLSNDPTNPNMFPVIQESLPIQNASPKMNNSMKKIKLISSKLQPPNLKRILTTAKFESNPMSIMQIRHPNVTIRAAKPVKR